MGITTFAVIAGAVGAQLSFVAVIAMGLANLIADAFSMGLGELTSSSAEHEYELGKQALKSKQVEEDPAHNELLLVKLYMEGLGSRTCLPAGKCPSQIS